MVCPCLVVNLSSGNSLLHVTGAQKQHSHVFAGSDPSHKSWRPEAGGLLRPGVPLYAVSSRVVSSCLAPPDDIHIPAGPQGSRELPGAVCKRLLQ